MFDDLAKKTNKVEDIFSGTEATAKPDTSRPGALPVTPTTPPPFASAMTGGEAGENKSEKMKKILVFAILIIAVVLIIFGIFWVLKKIDSSLNKEPGSADKQEEILPEGAALPVTEENQPPAPAPSPTTEEPLSPAESMFFPPEVTEPTDSDQDGLSDEEEETLGTNINNIDTDNDGLFDREEVKVYKTNPLVADTDGDGYLDGDEVKNGYNPNGAGKLYEIE